jgi:hypothetical protein
MRTVDDEDAAGGEEAVEADKASAPEEIEETAATEATGLNAHGRRACQRAPPRAAADGASCCLN